MSETARTWSLRLLALGIALGLWFNASLQDRLVYSERLVEAGVSYNRPPGIVILHPAQNVSVRLRGSKKAVRQLNPVLVNVTVDLPQRQPEGTALVSLGPSNVSVPDGLEVVSIEPASIRVEWDGEVSQRLPVVAQLTGRPARGVTLDEPEVFPNQVLVNGPRSLVSRADHLSTEPVSLEGRSTTFEESVLVIPSDPLIQVVQPTRVSVKVPLHKPDEAQAPEPRKDDR